MELGLDMEWDRLMGGRGGGMSCCCTVGCFSGLLGEVSVAAGLDLEAAGASAVGDCSGDCSE